MSAAQIIPEMLWTVMFVIYYTLESFVLALVPKRFRTRKDISDEVSYEFHIPRKDKWKYVFRITRI
jgi:hypothetical protein